jgi:hypothetical protein
MSWTRPIVLSSETEKWTIGKFAARRFDRPPLRNCVGRADRCAQGSLRWPFSRQTGECRLGARAEMGMRQKPAPPTFFGVLNCEMRFWESWCAVGAILGEMTTVLRQRNHLRDRVQILSPRCYKGLSRGNFRQAFLPSVRPLRGRTESRAKFRRRTGPARQRLEKCDHKVTPKPKKGVAQNMIFEAGLQTRYILS